MFSTPLRICEQFYYDDLFFSGYSHRILVCSGMILPALPIRLYQVYMT